LAGAALGGLAALLPVLWVQLQNPWFLDRPGLYLLLVVLPLGLAGAVLGLLLRRWLGRLPLGLAAAACLLCGLSGPAAGWLWPRPGPVSELQLLVVGIDGATFELIDGFGDALPEIQALRERGISADLQAAEPMFSPLLWTTMSTGKTPEQHGVHGFNVHSDSCRSARWWEIMDEAGLSTAVYKWLVTYPPQQIGLFQVPAWLAPGPETWPAELSFVKEIELSRRLKRRQVVATRGNLALALDGVQHGFRFGTLVAAGRFMLAEKLQGPSPERAHRDGQLLRVLMDRDVFIWLLHRDRPQVASFTDYATDAIGHRFWQFFEPELFGEVAPEKIARWGDSIETAYRQADALLGELQQQLGPEARIVVVSDHGFEALPAEDSGAFFAPRTERLRALVEQRVGPAELVKLGHKVVVTVLEDDPALALERLVTLLQGLDQASTGQPFYRWEPVEDDPRSLGLTLRDEHVTRQRLETDTVAGLALGEFVNLTEAYTGMHARDGVLMAAGPGICGGLALDPLTHLDVTPIVLAMASLPAAQDMLGRVPDELFCQPPALVEGPASYDHLVSQRKVGAGQQGVNEDQLRALGYIE